MKFGAIALALMTLVSVTTGTHAESWTDQDRLQRFREQIFHWGQKGDLQPNNGWSNYGSLRFHTGGAQQLIFRQTRGELLATLSLRASGKVEFEALSIQKVALLYRGKKPVTCAPDAIEALGIQAEFVLFFLSRAFPLGPTALSTRAERNVAGPPSELRFLQAVARQRGSWRAKVIAVPAPTALMPVSFEIHQADQPSIVGEWNPNIGTPAVADSAPLDEWHRCWYGAMDVESGQPIDRARAERLDTLKTVGEVRGLRE